MTENTLSTLCGGCGGNLEEPTPCPCCRRIVELEEMRQCTACSKLVCKRCAPQRVCYWCSGRGSGCHGGGPLSSRVGDEGSGS